MSLTVLHLLSFGDGGDGPLRVAALRAGGPGDRGVRHLVGAVGPAEVERLPVRLDADLRFPAVMGAPAGGGLRLLREAVARNVGLVHAWGPAAAELASVAIGLGSRTHLSNGLGWVASDLPPGWRPPSTGVPPRRQVECPSPAGPESAPPDRQSARAALKLPPAAPVVLYVSPLSPDSDVLTAAWSCSVASQVHRDLHVLALGYGTQAGKWNDLLKRGTVWPRCRHLPRVADWPGAIAAADVVLDTDLRPTISAALSAALAAGLPAVLSDTPSRRAAAAGKPAEFCPPGSPREHARAIHLAVAASVARRSAADLDRRAAAGCNGVHPREAEDDLNRIYRELAT